MWSLQSCNDVYNALLDHFSLNNPICNIDEQTVPKLLNLIPFGFFAASIVGFSLAEYHPLDTTALGVNIVFLVVGGVTFCVIRCLNQPPPA